ncbi:putative membrane protein [Haladaptatus paucihalophilus DX253]|uniref:Putative membrane protein n=1 Tax=Haladaptatus paucihalophilus DX253 TaxID=797209 RepID=E7QWT7_HALPU|nr:putative membrane protein [Haladaptatus paucihalophilus DX253]
MVCVDRNNDIGRKTGLEMPVAGWEAVQALVTDVGLADPEDSSVNCLLEALRVARDLRDGDEESIVAVISGTADTRVGADRAVAAQMDELVAEHDPDSTIVVIDSAEDERLVPIVESRTRVDAVDRVVVRQARDIESTYYLLKQFLADEELRQTVLVPTGIALIAFPVLLLQLGLAMATSAITAVIGLFVLYKGLAIGDYFRNLPAEARDALYSGRVSIVTYVVGVGLSLIGVFAGALRAAPMDSTGNVLMTAMAFVFESVPWIAVAALTASTGRLLDEAIRNDRVRNSYLNLPFGVLAVGLVVRGFSAYFLQRAGKIAPVVVPKIVVGQTTIQRFTFDPGMRLAVYVVLGVLVSLVGVRVASYVSGTAISEELVE